MLLFYTSPEVYTIIGMVSRISDITISMKALDYLNMPDCIPTRYEVEMNAEERKLYDIIIGVCKTHSIIYKAKRIIFLSLIE